MHSSPISSQNPSSIGGIFPQNSNKYAKSFATAQIPPSILIEFRPWASAVAVSRGNYYTNVVSCKRNRLYVRNSVNQEQKSKISQEKGAPGNGGGSPSTSLLSFLCPLLKLFSAGDPSAERNYALEEATSSLSTLARLPWGSRSLSDGSNNVWRADLPLPLQLFEFEACPFCRRVREAITELDLSVEIYPCPKGSVRHRAMVKRLGGREQFPFLVDPNTGTSMYESSDIVKYLLQQYGGNRSPSFGILESTLLTGWVRTLLRAGRGMTLWENSVRESPPRKLELFSYENNPLHGGVGVSLSVVGGGKPFVLDEGEAPVVSTEKGVGDASRNGENVGNCGDIDFLRVIDVWRRRSSRARCWRCPPLLSPPNHRRPLLSG